MATTKNEPEMRDYLERNLDKSSQDQAKKLSFKDMLVLQHNIKQLYNSACHECQQKMRLNPQKFKNFNDFCESCQSKQSIVKVFKILEKLNKRSQ